MELLDENGGIDENIEFDYNSGDFPYLSAFLLKVTDDIDKLTFSIDLDSNLSPRAN